MNDVSRNTGVKNSLQSSRRKQVFPKYNCLKCEKGFSLHSDLQSHDSKFHNEIIEIVDLSCESLGNTLERDEVSSHSNMYYMLSKDKVNSNPVKASSSCSYIDVSPSVFVEPHHSPMPEVVIRSARLELDAWSSPSASSSKMEEEPVPICIVCCETFSCEDNLRHHEEKEHGISHPQNGSAPNLVLPEPLESNPLLDILAKVYSQEELVNSGIDLTDLGALLCEDKSGKCPTPRLSEHTVSCPPKSCITNLGGKKAAISTQPKSGLKTFYYSTNKKTVTPINQMPQYTSSKKRFCNCNCNICSKRFTSILDLENHRKQHFMEKHCPYCNLSLLGDTRLSEHIKTTHPKKVPLIIRESNKSKPRCDSSMNYVQVGIPTQPILSSTISNVQPKLGPIIISKPPENKPKHMLDYSKSSKHVKTGKFIPGSFVKDDICTVLKEPNPITYSKADAKIAAISNHKPIKKIFLKSYKKIQDILTPGRECKLVLKRWDSYLSRKALSPPLHGEVHSLPESSDFKCVLDKGYESSPNPGTETLKCVESLSSCTWDSKAYEQSLSLTTNRICKIVLERCDNMLPMNCSSVSEKHTVMNNNNCLRTVDHCSELYQLDSANPSETTGTVGIRKASNYKKIKVPKRKPKCTSDSESYSDCKLFFNDCGRKRKVSNSKSLSKNKKNQTASSSNVSKERNKFQQRRRQTWECSICCKKLSSETLLLKHNTREHQFVTLKCTVCQFVFTDPEYFSFHVKTCQ